MRNLIIAISLICLCAFTGSFVLCTKDTLAVDGGPTGWWTDSDGNNYYGDSPSSDSPSYYNELPQAPPSTEQLEQWKRLRQRREANKLNAKGIEYDQREEYENALRLYEEALRIDPDNSVLRSNVLLGKAKVATRKGIEHREKGDFDTAIRYFKEALVYSPNHSTIKAHLRLAEEKKKEQAEKARLEKEARLLEQKLKEAKQNVNNILDEMAKKFDVSPPVGASKSSGLALKGSSVTNKPGKPSSSSGLSLKGSPKRLFEKGTKDSAPVDVIREADEITRQLYRQELMKDFEDSPEGDEITQQLFRQDLVKDFENSREVSEEDKIMRQLYRQELMKDFDSRDEEIMRQLYRQELMKDLRETEQAKGGEAPRLEVKKWPGQQNPEPPLLNPLWTDEEKKTKIQEWAGRSIPPEKWPADWTDEERKAAVEVFLEKSK
ncbi:MAG: tetratricopeptide repeat protein [Candidatus Brocadiales bacterium]|nr:tetratricopeptide repeat protein [Candidatus Bathyanammoxibius sp.]